MGGSEFDSHQSFTVSRTTGPETTLSDSISVVAAEADPSLASCVMITNGTFEFVGESSPCSCWMTEAI